MPMYCGWEKRFVASTQVCADLKDQANPDIGAMYPILSEKRYIGRKLQGSSSP